ncbi:PKD domain-containing protein [Patescibacteria group bacterium]|nr:PKD domain-containing protein [Patescibacteria group bacterium]MBU1683541.1 PKD domain-containing protein [Patescibacteria group bacterium]MBU1935007.1 PKD domain-containing protein [Patescibacteria group bacterium]
MIKRLFQITAIAIILFLLPTVSIQASGKIEAQLGEKVSLEGKNIPVGSDYKWIIKQGTEIISTQTSPLFNYTFVQQGEYDVNLVVTDASNQVKTTSVFVLVGDRYQRPADLTEEGEVIPVIAPLTVVFATLPPIQGDGTVHLIGDGKVLFDIEVTRDDVLEYRIDRNIFKDSDGNGVANDDIDNASDDSYLLGGMWHTEYDTAEATKIVAEITLVTREGEKTKQQVEIVFASPVRPEGDPTAILDVIPYPDSDDQLVHLYDDEEMVAFYSRRSEGEIIEYRIDKNIFVDSDGDGDPDNDIDNINDISFKNGDVWKTSYQKTDQQIIAQLIVVGENGKGSRVQRGLWFTDKPKPSFDFAAEQQGIRLTADKSFVLKGDPITYTLEGLTQTLNQYAFAWDFDGDGELDKEIEADNTVSHIYDTANIYETKVTVTDTSGNSADFTLEILVKDVISTIADFESVIEGNTVTFTNRSTAALNLASKTLSYNWSFGDSDPDGYEAQKDQIGLENPSYTYNKAGTYIVTLTVTDSDDVTDIRTAEVIIEFDLVPDEEVAEESAAADEEGEGGSIIMTILKIILYLVLIVIVLAILIIAGFLVFLKVQTPDLTFGELVDEFKIKILTMLGIHDMIEEPMGDQMGEQVEGAVESSGEEEMDPRQGGTPSEIEEEPAEEPELAKETGPTPDWMKDMGSAPVPVSEPEREVIEGEIEEPMEGPVEGPMGGPIEEPAPSTPKPTSALESTPEPAPHAPAEPTSPTPPAEGGETPPLAKQEGPVPDWLK